MYTYYLITLRYLGGQGFIADNDYALKGCECVKGGSTKMIMYYMNISVQLLFKDVRYNSSFNQLYVLYYTYRLFYLCCPFTIIC